MVDYNSKVNRLQIDLKPSGIVISGSRAFSGFSASVAVYDDGKEVPKQLTTPQAKVDKI